MVQVNSLKDELEKWPKVPVIQLGHAFHGVQSLSQDLVCKKQLKDCKEVRSSIF
jgi:hypothetical protein